MPRNMWVAFKQNEQGIFKFGGIAASGAGMAVVHDERIARQARLRPALPEDHAAISDTLLTAITRIKPKAAAQCGWALSNGSFGGGDSTGLQFVGFRKR
jgi:hypothetical protein